MPLSAFPAMRARCSIVASFAGCAVVSTLIVFRRACMDKAMVDQDMQNAQTQAQPRAPTIEDIFNGIPVVALQNASREMQPSPEDLTVLGSVAYGLHKAIQEMTPQEKNEIAWQFLYRSLYQKQLNKFHKAVRSLAPQARPAAMKEFQPVAENNAKAEYSEIQRDQELRIAYAATQVVKKQFNRVVTLDGHGRVSLGILNSVQQQYKEKGLQKNGFSVNVIDFDVAVQNFHTFFFKGTKELIPQQKNIWEEYLAESTKKKSRAFFYMNFCSLGNQYVESVFQNRHYLLHSLLHAIAGGFTWPMMFSTTGYGNRHTTLHLQSYVELGMLFFGCGISLRGHFYTWEWCPCGQVPLREYSLQAQPELVWAMQYRMKKNRTDTVLPDGFKEFELLVGAGGEKLGHLIDGLYKNDSTTSAEVLNFFRGITVQQPE